MKRRPSPSHARGVARSGAVPLGAVHQNQLARRVRESHRAVAQPQFVRAGRGIRVRGGREHHHIGLTQTARGPRGRRVVTFEDDVVVVLFLLAEPLQHAMIQRIVGAASATPAPR